MVKKNKEIEKREEQAEKGCVVKDEEKNSNYFLSEDKNVQFFSSGCTRLDNILGGGWAEKRTFNVIGDRSSNKCLKNSYILSDKGFILIDDLGRDKDYGFTDFKEKLVITKDKYDTTSKFWKDTVNKTIKIKTQHGFEIEGTPNHPILVLDSACNYVMKQLKDIKKEDVCVIIKGTNKFSAKYISLEKIVPKTTNVKDIALPDIINEDIGALLGYFIASGRLTSNGVQLDTKGKWFNHILLNILARFNLKLNKYGVISSVVLYHIIKNLLSSHLSFADTSKFVPNCILQSPQSVQVAFLQALIDCGSYSDAKSCLLYNTKSETLAKQVQLMLLNLGIITTRCFVNNTDNVSKFYAYNYWSLSIYSSDLIKYTKIVGSSKYNFTNLLPKFKNLFEDLAESNIFNLSFYKDLLYQEYHFDYVSNIEEKNEVTDVYDVHIPESHLFWSNGFISHNTGGGVEACINFLIKYPQGRIVYVEAESAFDENYANKIGLVFNQKNIILIKDVTTVEQLYNKLMELSGIIDDNEIIIGKKNKDLKINTIPTLVIVDTWDGLSDVAEMERDISEGSFGGSRPKKSHELFRKLNRKITNANITLGIISQVKDNIGVTFGDKETIACKHAIEFWSSQRVKLAHIKHIHKTIDGIELPIGSMIRAKCIKNKVARPHRICDFPVYYEMGMNDLEANINWLDEVKKLRGENGFDFSKYGVEVPQRNTTLIERLIENEKFNEIRKDISDYVIKCWKDIEEKFKPPYKKYG